SGVAKSVAGGGWQTLSGIFESVLAIAADPVDPSRVYAGTFSGLFQTADGGAEWAPVFEVVGLMIGNIAVRPMDSATVYVVTSDEAVMTDDGGTTWLPTGLQRFNFSFSFAVDPVVSTTVYAASRIGSDIFVARLAADGRSLEYSTLLGGTDYEWGS